MKSPIKLVKHPLLFGLVERRWSCDDARLKAAEFQDRKDPSITVIIHPSTKAKGRWQASFFENGEPVRDVQASSCEIALRDVSHRKYRLRHVISR